MEKAIDAEIEMQENIWPRSSSQLHKKEEDGFQKEIRVAAYCRVSTDLDEQQDSFELQQKYYTRLISRTPGWRLAGIYTDQGITGTARKQRTGLERLIRHCEEGKIDRILCKSISRFARNTIDLLEIVRRLKDLGINIIFEKEDIDTLSVQSEFVLSTIAALAQEESRSISENMTWSFRKQFQHGIPVFRKILGYDVTGKGLKNKKISVNEEEAVIVGEIFRMFLDGHWYTAICREMMRKGYKSVKDTDEWSAKTVKDILQNERYTGDVLCQKSYTADYLTHKKITNSGERQQYLIENHHPALIDKNTFEAVQKIIDIRPKGKQVKHLIYPLSRRLICGKCGSVMHRYTGNPRISWACSRRNKSRILCDALPIDESTIFISMVKAFSIKYDLLDPNVIHKMKLDINRLQDHDQVEQRRLALKRELISALSDETHAIDSDRQTAMNRRREIEDNLADQEGFWKLLESDRKYRSDCYVWLEGIPRGENRIKVFHEEFNISLARAWVTKVVVLSQLRFEIIWFDRTSTLVDLN